MERPSLGTMDARRSRAPWSRTALMHQHKIALYL
jgi:hypothetical protein